MKLDKGINAKMIEQKIKNFSDAELSRVFKACVGYTVCIRHLKKCIATGLTIQDIFRRDKMNKKLEDYLNNRSGSFYKALFDAIFVADKGNLEKLKKGFPDEVKAVRYYRCGMMEYDYYRKYSSKNEEEKITLCIAVSELKGDYPDMSPSQIRDALNKGDFMYAQCAEYWAEEAL